MIEREPQLNLAITKAVTDIYSDCRENIDAYNSPSGIRLKLGGTDWTVVYWPESSETDESLTVLRDWQKLKNPVSYSVLPTGYVTKNETIRGRAIGGVFFDSNGERPVVEESEVFMLQAIVMAAHKLSK